MGIGQQTYLDWQPSGVPVSRRFADNYYSLEDGLAESQHVFLAGNRLPDRFRPGFHIAELGFGTGLNMLVALMAWRAAGITGPLGFTSFEAYPLQADEMETALAAFPEALQVAGPMLDAVASGRFAFATPDIVVQIVPGDARERLPDWRGSADAWFLDGFAPARNPELWEPELMGEVASHTAPGGTCATYTAAGEVRRALAGAGFAVERVPGFGRKRHMTLGRMA